MPGNTQPVNREIEQGRNTGAGDKGGGGWGALPTQRDNQKQTEEQGLLGTRRTPCGQTPAEPDRIGPSGPCWSLCGSDESWQAEADRSEGKSWLQLALTHTWLGSGLSLAKPSAFLCFLNSFPVHVGFSSVSSEPALLTILPIGWEPECVEESSRFRAQ